MPDQRHQKYFGRDSVELPDSVETEPRLTFRLIELEVGLVFPMCWQITLLLTSSRTRHRRTVLRGIQVDLGFGEIRESSSVIHIHVSEHDMSYVVRGKTEPLNVPKGRLCRIEKWPNHAFERFAQPRIALGNIVSTQAGIHEDQARFGFDQQNVADEFSLLASFAADQASPDGAHRCAVKVMDFHGW